MRPLLVALAISLLAGCASAPTRSSMQEIKDAREQVDSALAALRSGQQDRTPDGVRIIEDQLYVPPDAVDLNAEKLIPASCPITYAPSMGVTLQAFSQRVTKTCGIPVRITPDAVAASSGNGTGAAGAASAGPGNATTVASAMTGAGIPLPAGVSLPPPVAGGVVNSMPVQISSENSLIDVRYSGELAGLMDIVTSRLGLSWRYRNGTITVFYTETKFYKIFALPKAQSIRSTTNSGSSMTAGVSSSGIGGATTTSSAGADASTSCITTSDDISIDPMKDVREGVQSLLTPGVGRMASPPQPAPSRSPIRLIGCRSLRIGLLPRTTSGPSSSCSMSSW